MTAERAPSVSGATLSDAIAAIKAKFDIYKVAKRHGVDLNLRGNSICPFHNDTNPSFSVYENDRKFKCHGAGCGVQGDIIDFVQKIQNVDFWQALNELAREAGIALPHLSEAELEQMRQRRLREQILDVAVEFYEINMPPDVLAYLHKRGVTDELIKIFRIGYAGILHHDLRETGLSYALSRAGFTTEDGQRVGLFHEAPSWELSSPIEHFKDCIVFPIIVGGRVVNVTSRDCQTGQPKHLPGPKQHFYNEDAIHADHVITTEGPIDCIVLDGAGYDVIATLGSDPPKSELLNKLKKCKNISVCNDGDDAGRTGAITWGNVLGRKATIVELPDKYDPDVFLLERGKEALDALITKAVDSVSHVVNKINPETDRLTLMDELEPVMDVISTRDAVEIEARLDQLKKRFNLNDHEIDAYRQSIHTRSERTLNTAARDRGPQTNIDSAAPREGVVAERVIPIYTAYDASRLTPENVPWIATRWAAEGTITELVGKVKAAGKTTLMMDMVAKVLDGQPFLGEATTQTPVVYLTEQPRNSYRKAMSSAGLCDRKDLHILYHRDSIGIAWPLVAARAISLAESVGAKLIIVDTLGQFAGLKHDEENLAGAALDAVLPLQIATTKDICVIVARHERKSGGDVGESGRGSSAFAGAVDIVLALGRPPGAARSTIRVLNALSRFEETPPQLMIELTTTGYVTLGTEVDVATQEARKNILNALPSEPAAALTIKDLMKLIKGLKRTIAQEVLKWFPPDTVQRIDTGKKKHPYRFYRVLPADKNSICQNPPYRGSGGNGSAAGESTTGMSAPNKAPDAAA